MRLAIVHPSLGVKGGAENVVMWLAREWACRDHDVTVFTSAYDEAYFGPRASHPFGIVTQNLGGYQIHPVKFILAGWRLRESLAGFDWVNPHNFPSYHWVYWARRFNQRIGRVVWFCEEPMRWFYPEVCNPHILELRRQQTSLSAPSRPTLGATLRVQLDLGGRLETWKWNAARAMDLRIVPHLDRIFANSEFIAKEVRTIFRVEAQACLLGAPPDRLKSGTTREIRPPVARPYLLTVSRLFPEKNVGTVLEAVKVLKDRGALPFARYVVAGDGPLKGNLLKLARDLGVAEVTEFLGFVSDNDLASLYQHAALVIYVPLDETFGLIFPEAAFWRKATIGPDHGGPAEIVRHGETGLQVDATDPRAIADAIATCMGQPALLARFGNAAYEYAMAELTFSRFVDRFDHLLGTPPDATPQADGAPPFFPSRIAKDCYQP